MSPERQKIKAKELDEFRELLLSRRTLLAGDVSNMSDNALKKSTVSNGGELSKVPYHMADVGTENFEHEFTLGLIENEEEELREIDEALRRIEAGTFGTCETCEKPIPKARLKAIPYARLCIECKQKEEGAPGL